MPGESDELGQVVIGEDFETGFVTPANRGGGSNRDVGSLALMLIANWFINGECALFGVNSLLNALDYPGETVLIDGGVSASSLRVCSST